MAIKHNNQIPNNHFRKHWQRRVRVHFDQAGKKKSRRDARLAKAAAIAPRPLDKLRPVVRCPTLKYNRRVRPGRGFSLQELKEAGIPRKLAATIGIAVDPRRQNISEESLKANVARLAEYKNRLVVFPRRSGKTKTGDATPEEVKAVKAAHVSSVAASFPITQAVGVSEAKLADVKGEEAAFRKLRLARSDARYAGARRRRTEQKAEEAAAAKK